MGLVPMECDWNLAVSSVIIVGVESGCSLVYIAVLLRPMQKTINGLEIQ